MNGFYVNCSCVDECRNRVVDFYCTLIICGWEYAGYLNIWRLPLHNTTGIMRFWKWQLFWASKAYKRKVLEVCFGHRRLTKGKYWKFLVKPTSFVDYDKNRIDLTTVNVNVVKSRAICCHCHSRMYKLFP